MSIVVEGLERDFLLLFNPIIVSVTNTSSISVESVLVKLEFEGLEFNLINTFSRGQTKIRIDKAIMSIISAPKLQEHGFNQEGVYRIKLTFTALGVISESVSFTRNFIYGGSDFSKLKHSTNNSLIGPATTLHQPFFKGYPNYYYNPSNNALSLLPILVTQDNSVPVHLSNNCDMRVELQYRNRLGGVNYWVFNNYTIKPSGKNEKYSNPLNDFEYQERGDLKYDITLFSKCDKSLRPYIESVIGTLEVRARGLTVDNHDNLYVTGNSTEWVNLNYESLNITETHSRFIEIELKLSI